MGKHPLILNVLPLRDCDADFWIPDETNRSRAFTTQRTRGADATIPLDFFPRGTETRFTAKNRKEP